MATFIYPAVPAHYHSRGIAQFDPQVPGVTPAEPTLARITKITTDVKQTLRLVQRIRARLERRRSGASAARQSARRTRSSSTSPKVGSTRRSCRPTAPGQNRTNSTCTTSVQARPADLARNWRLLDRRESGAHTRRVLRRVLELSSCPTGPIALLESIRSGGRGGVAERTSSGGEKGPERGLQVPRAGPVGCTR